jgi:hypothetical protein
VVSNCANPACATPLRYLRDGRLYQFEVKFLGSPEDELSAAGTRASKKKGSRKVWHYWLCGSCSSNLTLKFDQLQGLKLIPLHSAFSSQLAS